MIHRTRSHTVRTGLTLGLFALWSTGTAIEASPATDVGGPVAPGTIWTAAGSPYRTTANVEVPAGVTLTVEPGVEVLIGFAHSITVEGSLRADGTADRPIVFTAADPEQPWTSVILSESSGPSVFRHVHFSRNGARRTAMLEIYSNDVSVSDSRFEDAGGVALDVRNASPTIERSLFRNASAANSQPQGALRIRGASDPTVTNNLFQSNNNAPIYLDANASPILDGNRFEFNGWNGVLLAGNTDRAVTIRNLGPRRWSYWIESGGVNIREGGSLTVEPGATFRVNSVGLQVHGTLRVLGEAGAKVLFTSASVDPAPGKWRDITFFSTATPYDPETGEGSMIDHTIIRYAGAVNTGALNIQNSSPLIANSVFEESANRGVTVSGASAAPIFKGNLFFGLDNPEGSAVFVSGGAAPTIAYSIFQDNLNGVESQSGAVPHVGPLNRFDRNLEFGIVNRDASLCVPAEENDWSAPEGPLDPSPRADTCGLESNSSSGDLVSDNVGYAPWAGQLPRPYISSPHCGTQRAANPVISGFAPAGSSVLVYDNFEVIGQTEAAAGDGMTPFQFQSPALAAGSHVFAVRAESGDESSGLSEFLEFNVDPSEIINPSQMYISYDLDGMSYRQPLNDPTGCATVKGGEWEIRVHPDLFNPSVGAKTTLHVPVVCPSGAPQARLLYEGQDVAMVVSAGVAEAEFDPGAGGILNLEVTCAATVRRYFLGTVSVEYDGFVYNAATAMDPPSLDRVAGATVTLFALDPDGRHTVWDGGGHFGQTNPQVTGPFGWHGFYPPPGMYRVTVSHPDYMPFMSRPIEVTSQPVMVTVGLRPPTLFLPSLRTKNP